MGFVSRLLAPQGIQAVNPGDERLWGGAYVNTHAGVSITPETAMAISTVNACVRIISNALAMLPLPVFRRTESNGKERAFQHPLDNLLHDAPNGLENSMQFRQRMQKSLLLRHNAYSRIVPGPRGAVDQLIPLHPDRVWVEELPGGRKRFHHWPLRGDREILLQDEVLHLYTMSDDGIRGFPMIDYARESFGLAAAAEAYGARVYTQAPLHSGILTHPGTLKAETRQQLKEEISEEYGGLAGAHKTMILQEGMEWKQLSLSPEQLQLLQARQYQTAEIAEWFGVPLELLQAARGTTTWGRGIEQLLIAFLTFTMDPWFVLWEQTINSELILNKERFFVEFVREALLRSTPAARGQFYRTMVMMGVMTRNEVRVKENLNILPGLDEPLTPLNMREGDDERQERGRQTQTASGPIAADPHHRALVLDAASRVVRKEAMTLRKLAQKHAEDLEAFHLAVDGFYEGEHRAWVRETMRISGPDAIYWCQIRATEIKVDGIQAVESWEVLRVMDLADSVLGGEHDATADARSG